MRNNTGVGFLHRADKVSVPVTELTDEGALLWSIGIELGRCGEPLTWESIEDVLETPWPYLRESQFLDYERMRLCKAIVRQANGQEDVFGRCKQIASAYRRDPGKGEEGARFLAAIDKQAQFSKMFCRGSDQPRVGEIRNWQVLDVTNAGRPREKPL